MTILNYGTNIGKESWAKLAVEYHCALEYPLVISYIALISASNLICWDIEAFSSTRRVALEENWRLMSFWKQAHQLENKTGLDYLDLKLQLHMIVMGLKTVRCCKYCVFISLNLSSVFRKFQPKTLFFTLWTKLKNLIPLKQITVLTWEIGMPLMLILIPCSTQSQFPIEASVAKPI